MSACARASVWIFRGLGIAFRGYDLDQPLALGNGLLPHGRGLFFRLDGFCPRLFGQNALLGNAALLIQTRCLDTAARRDLSFLGFLLAHRLFLDKFGALRRASGLDIAFLRQARIFAFAIDLKHAALRFKILVADFDDSALLDFVAHAAAQLDRLGHLGETFCIKGVRGVEEFELGLVDVDNGNRLQFQPLGVQHLGGKLAHPARELVTPFVHLFHCHLRRNGAKGAGRIALRPGRADR